MCTEHTRNFDHAPVYAAMHNSQSIQCLPGPSLCMEAGGGQIGLYTPSLDAVQAVKLRTVKPVMIAI